MKKRIMSLLLAMVMTVSLLPGVAVAAKVENFSDVSKDIWYYKYVDFVTEEGYFAGTSETTFSPDMTMTRAMFVVVMAALEGVKVNNNVAPFADVPANTWYSGAVDWAAKNGVIAGVGGNKFAPDAEITREQMAVIMNAYINWHSEKHGEDHDTAAKVETFGDKANVSSWAVEAVDNCRGWGLIAGAPDGNFYPQNNASRAEVATVVYNLAWLVMGGGGSTSKFYSVTYYMNDGTEDKFDTVKNIRKNTAHEIIDDEPTRTGYTFVEWNAKKDGSGTAYVSGDTITSDSNVKLYAQWTPASEYTDYIYEAVKGVMSDVADDAKLLKDKTSIDETVKNFLNDHDLMKYVKAQNNGSEGFVVLGGENSFVSVTGVELDKTSTARPIEVTGLVKVETETLVNLYDMAYATATNYATELVLGLVGAGAIDEATAKEIANDIADKFESITGITVSVETVKAAAKDIYAAAKKVQENALPYAKGLWIDNFKGADGYYTSNVEIAVEDETIVTIAVDDETYLADTTKKQAVIDMASAIARALVADLKGCTSYTALNEIDPDVEVAVNFSVPANDYAEDVDYYPTEYPITFALDIEGTAADSVMYMFDNGTNHIKFVVSDKIQNAYNELANKLVKEAVLDALNDKMDAILGGMDFTFGSTYSLRSRAAAPAFDFEALKKEAMEAWLDGNLTTDNIADSPMMDYITSDGAVDNFDHSALFDLIDATLDNALDQTLSENNIAGNPTSFVGKVILEGLSDPAQVEKTLTDWVGEEVYKQMDEMGLVDYTVAKTKDYVNGDTNYAEEARADMEQQVSDMVMKELDKVVAPEKPEDAVVPNIDKYLDLAAKVSKLATVDGMTDITFGNLATVLTNDRVQNFLDGRGDSVVNRVADLIKYIPDSASVKMFGKTIDEEALADVRDAETTVELCDALAEIVDMFADVTLGDFDDDGQIIAVNAAGKTVKFGLAIDF